MISRGHTVRWRAIIPPTALKQYYGVGETAVCNRLPYDRLFNKNSRHYTDGRLKYCVSILPKSSSRRCQFSPFDLHNANTACILCHIVSYVFFFSSTGPVRKQISYAPRIIIIRRQGKFPFKYNNVPYIYSVNKRKKRLACLSTGVYRERVPIGAVGTTTPPSVLIPISKSNRIYTN